MTKLHNCGAVFVTRCHMCIWQEPISNLQPLAQRKLNPQNRKSYIIYRYRKNIFRLFVLHIKKTLTFAPCSKSVFWSV